MKRWLLLFGYGLASCAGDEAPAGVLYEISVRDLREAPVVGAQVFVEGRRLLTDALGIARTEVGAGFGTASLGLVCPSGYRGLEERRSVSRMAEQGRGPRGIALKCVAGKVELGVGLLFPFGARGEIFFDGQPCGSPAAGLFRMVANVPRRTVHEIRVREPGSARVLAGPWVMASGDLGNFEVFRVDPIREARGPLPGPSRSRGSRSPRPYRLVR